MSLDLTSLLYLYSHVYCPIRIWPRWNVVRQRLCLYPIIVSVCLIIDMIGNYQFNGWMDDTGQVEVVQRSFQINFVISEQLAEIWLCGTTTHRKLFL